MLLNAGVLGEIKDLSDTTLAEIAAVMDVNVWANKVIYDTLRELDTRIQQLVAISSGAAFNGSGGWGAYSMSKSALNLMFRVYAHEISRGEDEVGTGMSAYRGADGWVIWEKPDFSYFGPCILHNDTVITNATMYKATFWKIRSLGISAPTDHRPAWILPSISRNTFCVADGDDCLSTTRLSRRIASWAPSWDPRTYHQN